MSAPLDPDTRPLYGIGGTPVDPPSPDSTDEQKMAHWYIAGHDHASSLIDTVIVAHHTGDTDLLNKAVNQAGDFQPAFEKTPLQFPRTREGDAYAIGMCAAVMAEVDRAQTALEWLQAGETDIAHAATDPQATGWRWNGRMQVATLHAVRDDLVMITEMMAHSADIPVPGERRTRWRPPVAEAITLNELAVAIDDYQLVQHAPRLRATDTDQDQIRGQLADRITELDLTYPHLIASLSDARARVLVEIVPDAADRLRHTATNSDTSQNAHYLERRLISIGDELVTRLLHPGTLHTPAGRTKIHGLVAEAQRILADDRNLAVKLQPLQAGLVRHLVRESNHTDLLLDRISSTQRSQPTKVQGSAPQTGLAWERPGATRGTASGDHVRGRTP